MSDAAPSDPDDPAVALPIEAAREHLIHWWREPLAGAIAVAIGTFDAWHYGMDLGLSITLDEALIVGGVVLIAGTRKMLSAAISGTPERQEK